MLHFLLKFLLLLYYWRLLMCLDSTNNSCFLGLLFLFLTLSMLLMCMLMIASLMLNHTNKIHYYDLSLNFLLAHLLHYNMDNMFHPNNMLLDFHIHIIHLHHILCLFLFALGHILLHYLDYILLFCLCPLLLYFLLLLLLLLGHISHLFYLIRLSHLHVLLVLLINNTFCYSMSNRILHSLALQSPPILAISLLYLHLLLRLSIHIHNLML